MYACVCVCICVSVTRENQKWVWDNSLAGCWPTAAISDEMKAKLTCFWLTRSKIKVEPNQLKKGDDYITMRVEMVSDCSAGGAVEVFHTQMAQRCHGDYDCNHRCIHAAPHTIECDFRDEKHSEEFHLWTFQDFPTFRKVSWWWWDRVGSVGTAKKTRRTYQRSQVQKKQQYVLEFN